MRLATPPASWLETPSATTTSPETGLSRTKAAWSWFSARSVPASDRTAASNEHTSGSGASTLTGRGGPSDISLGRGSGADQRLGRRLLGHHRPSLGLAGAHEIDRTVDAPGSAHGERDVRLLDA